MDESKSIRTQYGNIPLVDLPLIVNDTFIQKIERSLAIYIIIIIILCVFVYIGSQTKPAIMPCNINPMITAVPRTARITSIDVYSPFQRVIIENIILQCTDQNIINIDTVYNPYVKIFKKSNGLIYTIDFGHELDIQNITLVSSPSNYIRYINVDLYNGGNKVWEYDGHLHNRQINTIAVATAKINSYPLEEYDHEAMQEKGIEVINEDGLKLQLSETDENYVQL